MAQPEVHKIPERTEIDGALEHLVSLYEGWGLNPQTDWVLMDEFAMLLQGYNVKGLELATRHLDTFVNTAKLPWTPRDAVRSRMTIPPRESPQLQQYSQFMTTTRFGLKIHQAGEEVSEFPCDSHILPSGKAIRLWKPLPFLESFYPDTLLRFTAAEVGPTKIQEWEAKLQLIKEAAVEASDQALAELAEAYIQDWEERKTRQRRE